MCGFSGYITAGSKFIDEQILLRMRDYLAHRGPDDAGIWIDDKHRVGLGHRRLAILDLTLTGRQPMHDASERFTIVFNGEIYNHNELRRDLQNTGCHFVSRSDTEVLLQCFARNGNDGLSRVNGIFAFAIYDSVQKTLTLVRDRFGVKPLYYGWMPDGTFAFASELKSLCQYPDFPKRINYAAFGDYLKYRYIPHPRTIWENIYKLAPGNYAVLRLDTMGLRQQAYYSLKNAVLERNASCLEEVHSALTDAVNLELQADVESGVFLSGGIDSSTIAACASAFMPGIKAFSLGFSEKGHNEIPYARTVAEKFAVEHVTQTVNHLPYDIFEQLAICYDEPHADSSCIPTYMLCDLTGQHLKVVLSGDGGDEVFSGYGWYDKYLADEANGLALTRDSIESYYNRLLLNRFTAPLFEALFADQQITKIVNSDRELFREHFCDEFSSVRKLQYIDLQTFLTDDILSKVDRASMAHGLEVRVPFLDHRLVETVLALPETLFPSQSTGKPVLKQIGLELGLPVATLNRSKKGFSAPWNRYFEIGDLVLKGKAVEAGLFREEFVRDLAENRYPNSQAMLWMLFCFEGWFARWM